MGAPIHLGSAAVPKLVFEAGSTITTDSLGLQSCTVKALCPDAANAIAYIPAAGTPFNQVFGNSFLPADFKVNLTASSAALGGGGGSVTIEYLQGLAARITITFSRPDPSLTNPLGQTGRTVSVDSALNYKSILGQYGAGYYIAASGVQQPGTIGFPEPIAIVKYTSVNPPPIAGGTIASIYALPTDLRASGFPAIPNVVIPVNTAFSAAYIKGFGGTVPVTYFNNTTFVTFNMTQPTTFYFNATFSPNPLGWQLTKLKWDPVAGQAFYIVEEDWRTFYVFAGVTFVKKTSP